MRNQTNAERREQARRVERRMVRFALAGLTLVAAAMWLIVIPRLDPKCPWRDPWRAPGIIDNTSSSAPPVYIGWL